jgi:hypothetical protein
MAVATAHFTELGRTKSQGSFVLDVESMPVATAHFAKLDAEKKAVQETESGVVEVMPVAIQRFTMAAREEKLKMQASSGVEDVEVPVAMLHFTPGLSERLLVASV